jgi:hypothetical protein
MKLMLKALCGSGCRSDVAAHSGARACARLLQPRISPKVRKPEHTCDGKGIDYLDACFGG